MAKPDDSTYRTLLVRSWVEFCDADGKLTYLDAPEAAKWLNARDAKPDAAVTALVDGIDRASDETRQSLQRALLRVLGEPTLDDVVTLRDLLRALLIDAALADVNYQIPSVVNVPGIRAAARDEARELRARGITEVL